MGRSTKMAVWLLTGAAGLAVLIGSFPHTFLFYPEEWSTNREEATALALERFRDLPLQPRVAEDGEDVAGEVEAAAAGDPRTGDALLITTLGTNSVVERRLRNALGEVPLERLRASRLNRSLHWEVTAYPPGARTFEWSYVAEIDPRGELTRLSLRVPPEVELPEIGADEARRRADRFLEEQGFDLATLGEPVVRRTDRQNRSDLTLRYPDADPVLGETVAYGVAVSFAGDVLTGFDTWVEDPEESALLARLQPINLLSQLRLMAAFLLFPFVALFFLRRYHAGEVGVRRAVQIFAIAFVSGIVLMVLTAFSASEDVSFGLLSRRQVAFAWSFQLVIFWFSALSLLAALSWSVGEAWSRERWPQKLAAFDALFQGRVGNSTFARAALRGVAGGLALAGGLVALTPLLPGDHGAPTLGAVFGPWWESAAWPGVGLLLFVFAYGLYTELFGRLFLVSALVGRLGRWGAGLVVAALSGLIFWPVLGGTTALSSVGLGVVAAAVLVGLFLRYDLLTSLLASLTGSVAVSATPFLLADDPFLQLQGALPLFVVALPLLVSVRHLLGDRELVYRWEDVPPHVRRIAERERQRVELETARRIQSSILPELPPQLHGVELAHAYLPASEVGGDFYDVLALEDGRLALAVGDVAGHGVSSGLVMSMAKSALAVQVAFDPEVAAVFRTLNRTVYQSARKRLLATLCYAVLDPVRRELLYASAGHLFPYRVGVDGRVDALESVSYPLGVRENVEMMPREARLQPGDTLFLFSDGIVEARREGSDDMFGFERLEEALQRHAHLPVGALRDAVLADVERFTGPVPREDDQTVLVLRLPAA